MAAVTLTELSTSDLPSSLLYGTEKRRIFVHIRATSTGNDTLDLSSYIPNIADIEGLVYQTTGGAQFSSTATWSTYTLTVVDSGVAEIGLIATLN